MKTTWNKPTKKKKRRSFKTSKSLVGKKLDELWSKKVRERDNHKCRVCGNTEGINAHHIITRKNYALRWDLTNGISLCPRCHVYDSKQSAHGNPIWFDTWMKDNGIDKITLNLKAQQPVKRTIQDLHELYERLENTTFKDEVDLI